MAPIQMRNLTTFPIERLCFDLKLEVLEQLHARDVIELVKVNQGFKSMISSRPSIVSGCHVHKIEFRFEELKIKKLNSGSLEVSLDVIRHLPFIKNIRSCNQLCIGNYGSTFDEDHAAFLKQLEAVNSLCLLHCAPWPRELLSHLSIKSNAILPSFLRKSPSKKELVGHFIETQLNGCEEVEVHCHDDDDFQFYYNAFIKTHIECVVIICDNVNIDLPAIQRIVGQGIPSKNPAAVVGVWDDFTEDLKATIVVFLKGYPGMKQIKEKNRQPFVALANERLKVSGWTWMQALFFRRNINARRDCVYILSSKEVNALSYIYFFAFYIKPDEMIDH